MLKLLVESGADYTFCNQANRSPIYKAIYLCKLDIAEYLLTLPKTDLSQKDEN